MSTPLQPPPDGNVNRAPSMIAMWVAEPAIALIFTLVRAYGRWSIRSFGWDDITIFITTFLYIALAACVCVMAANGGAQHQYYVTPEQMMTVLKVGFANQTLATIAQGLSKVSVSLLLLRLIRSTVYPVQKVALWAGIILTSANVILQVFVTFFQCQNPQALWNPALVATTYCWNPSVQANIAIYTSSWNTFMDFALALMPLSIILRLSMPKARKAAISLLLSLGCLSGVFAAIKTSLLTELASRSDQLWQEYTLYAWVNAELFVVILCANMATLKIFYDRYVQHHSAASSYMRPRNFLRWPRSYGHSALNKQSELNSKASSNSAKSGGYAEISKNRDFAMSNMQSPTASTFAEGQKTKEAEDNWTEQIGIAKSDNLEQQNAAHGGIKVSQTFEVV